MSVQTPFFTGVSAAPLRITRALPFRIIPRIETYPKLVSFCQTVPGQAVLLGVFGGLYAIANANTLPLVLCLALLTWMPGQRNQLLCISTLFFALLVPWHVLPRPLYHAELVLSCLAFGWLLIWCRAKWPQSWYGKNAAEILIAGFGTMGSTHAQILGKFRNKHVAVGGGTHTVLSTSPYTFERQKGSDTVVVAFSVSGSTSLSVGSAWANGTLVRDYYTGATATVTGGKVTVTPGSAGVVLLESAQ